jgi:hypothetical protein
MFEVSVEPAAAAIARPRRGRGADLITVMLGTWLLVGVFVDGWAHNNLHGLETFFTPWHALLHSGYLAAGEWILWQLRPAVRGRSLTRTAVPLGYGWAAWAWWSWASGVSPTWVGMRSSGSSRTSKPSSAPLT